MIKKEDLVVVAEKILGMSGKMIGASKGQYNFDNPNNIVVFNSNICTEQYGKIWHGDIDVSKEQEKIEQLAKALSCKVYVLYEMDARFENEEKPKLEKAVFITDGEISDVGDNREDTVEANGKLYWAPKEPVEKEEEPEYDDSDRFNEDEFKLQLEVDMDSFKSKEESSPLDKFYEHIENWLTSEGLKKEDMKDVSLWCSKETSEELSKLVKNWLIDHYGLEEGTYALQREMSWLPLNLPVCFIGSLKGPKWVKKNVIYIQR